MRSIAICFGVSSDVAGGFLNAHAELQRGFQRDEAVMI